MRYLAIAAAALAATTSFASADSMPVAAGPMQLSAAQLDDVTAGRRSIVRINRSILARATADDQSQLVQNNAIVSQTSGACVAACNVAVVTQAGANINLLSANR